MSRKQAEAIIVLLCAIVGLLLWQNIRTCRVERAVESAEVAAVDAVEVAKDTRDGRPTEDAPAGPMLISDRSELKRR